MQEALKNCLLGTWIWTYSQNSCLPSDICFSQKNCFRIKPHFSNKRHNNYWRTVIILHLLSSLWIFFSEGIILSKILCKLCHFFGQCFKLVCFTRGIKWLLNSHHRISRWEFWWELQISLEIPSVKVDGSVQIVFSNTCKSRTLA